MIFNTVWVLMLTVCNPSQCLSQQVELFWTIEECYETKVEFGEHAMGWPVEENRIYM